MRVAIIVNIGKIDKKSLYGRITAIGDAFMKPSTMNKAKKVLACILAAAALGSQVNLAAASLDFLGTSPAKTVTVYDGAHKQVISTAASNFKNVLSDLHVSLKAYDTFWTSTKEVSDGAVIVVERAVPVSIIANGKKKVVYTTQQTVQGVVNDAGFDWKKMMPIEDGLMQVKEGMQIHVVPYTARKVFRKEAMPIHYNKWYDGSLGEDQEVVVQEGIPGEREVEIDEFISGGKVVKTVVAHAKVISDGTPGIMKTGKAEGTMGWVANMHASAYHPSDGGGSGITATGTQAGHGTVAVDPSVIPLGTNVFIPNYGHAVAADTGGAIVGNRIDLCMESFEDCYNFGRQNIEVFVNY